MSSPELDKVEIENKTNTELLIEYLEAVIVDEMILNSFIRNLKIVKKTNEKLLLSVPNKKNTAFLKENYMGVLKKSVNEIFQKPLRIFFQVWGEDSNPEAWKETKNNISKKYSFDNYVVAKFNEEAVKISKSLVKKPGEFSPFYVNSNSGLGKTHLLHSVGNTFIEAGLNAFYVEPNSFTRKVQQLSKKGGEAISNYIDEFGQYDLVLFDDIQNLGDRSVTLKVFFNIINHFLENDKQIVIASDKQAYELSGFENRFKTRFSVGINCKINNPDYDDLMKVLEFKLLAKNLSPEKWEREAIKFIVRNNSSSIRAIEGAVKRVSFFASSESNIKYTYTVISSFFSDLLIDQKELTTDRIIKIVASYYKINKGNITGKSRKKEFVLARHITMWLLKKIKDLSFVEIGKIVGSRDHSTVINAIKRIDHNIKINKTVEMALDKIEQKIKTVS